jgi:predicted  nucleic acid-binding Zn-ribbon protein
MSSRRKKEKQDMVEPEGGGGEQVFPDLHHKMSKKIAQLTKVIYHLNTKNEDNQSMIEAISQQHQIELDMVAKEAMTRMASTKELAEMKQKMMATASQMERLQKKHADEKAKTINDFEKFKKLAKDQEEKYTTEFEQKYDFLCGDYEKANVSFQEKLNAFEKAKIVMKSQLEEALSSGGSVASDMKKKHETELEECIRMSNEKYQAMLCDQLALQEQLKRDYEEKLAKLREETAAEWANRLENELGKLRASLNGEKQEALMAAKREHEAKQQEVREDLMSKIERAIVDLKAKSELCGTLQAESDELRRKLADTVAEMEARLAADMGSADQKVQNLNIELAQAKVKIGKLEASVQESEENVERLEKMLGDKNVTLLAKNDQVDSLQQQVDELSTELRRLEAASTAASGELSGAIAQAQRQLDENTKEIERLSKEKAKLEKSLGAAQLEMSSFQETAAKAKKALEGQVLDKQREVDDLNRRLKENTGSSAAEMASLQQELESMRTQLATTTMQAEKARTVMLEDHQQTISAVERKHSAALVAKESSISNLEERNQALQDSLAKGSADSQAAVAALKAEHAKQTEALKAEHAEELTKLRVMIAQLESEISNLSENADSEKATLQKDYAKVTEKYKNLKVEMEAKKREGEMAQSTISGLKTQIDDLREELKSTQRAYKEKMDMSLQKLEEDWQRKMQIMEDRKQEEMNTFQAELEAAWDKERAALVAGHDEVVKRLEEALSSTDASGKSALQALEKERIRLEIELEQEKKARHTEVAGLNSSHTSAIELLHQQHAEALEGLRGSLGASAESDLKALTDKHTEEISALKAKAAEAAEKSVKDQNTAVAAQKKASADDTMRKLSELDKRLKEVHAAELASLGQKEKNAMEKMTNEHALALDDLRKELVAVSGNLVTTKERATTAETDLAQTKALLEKTRMQAAMDKEQAIREGETRLRQEKEESQRALIEEKERSDAELRYLKGEFAEDRARFEDALQQAADEYKILEDRYELRESRPEDLARIAQLETEAVEKDELVKKTIEEMAYFKRELLNREESYNQKFNAKPNVGVMNVLPTNKGGNAASGKAGGAKTGVKSSKPTHVVGGGGGGMSMGGMGAMNLGGNPIGGAPGIPGASKGPALPGSSGSSRR